jgi:hypothetical protein
MNHPPPIIEYASASVAVDRPQFSRDGDVLVILIPPPRRRRMLGLLGLLMCSVTAAAIGTAGLAYAAAGSGAARLFELDEVVFLLLVWGLVSLFWRVARVAIHGRVPSVLRASASGLTSKVAPPWRRGSGEWPAARIVEVHCRAAGAMPALLTYIQLQIVLTNDSVDTALIPWNGVGALVTIEDNLTEALGKDRLATDELAATA